MANTCQLCNEAIDNLKNVFEKVQLDSDYANSTEIESNAINLIQKVFNLSQFTEKFYPEEVFKGICSKCLNELTTSYKFYIKLKNLQLRLNQNEKQHFRKILPKASEISTNKDCSSILLKTSNEPKKCERIRKKNDNILNYCKFCNTNFDNKKLLDMHVNDNHIDKKYFCRSCSQSFDLKAKFIKHFIGSRCKKARNYCFSCNYKEFEYKKGLKKHLKLVHGDNNLENCNKLSNNRVTATDTLKVDLPLELQSDYKPISVENIKEMAGSLTENALVRTESESPLDSDELIMDIEFLDDFFLNQDENSSQFNDCWEALGLNFMNLENDLEDLSIFTSEPTKKSTELSYKCPRCQQEFTNQHNLFLHLAHTHHEFVLVCSGCGSKFNRVDEFVNHKAEHFKENLTDPNYTNISENDSKTNLQCSKCKKSFKKKFNFLIHLCKNDNNIMVQCNFCTDIFPNWKKMHEHQKLIHSKKFQCTLCDEKQFTTLAGLKYHLKSHDGVKEFECPYCKKKFIAATNLNSHLKTIHANFKFHVCKLCDQRFATLGHLKKHVGSVHQKERNYLCSICSKGFAQSSHLKQHMEIHTGQRKYPCNYCFKGFSRKIDLKRHEDKHYEIFDNEFKVID